MADMAARDIALSWRWFHTAQEPEPKSSAKSKGGRDGTGDFCQCIVGLVCMGILYGDRLGAWYVGRGAIVGDGVARAAVDSPHRVQ